MLSSFGDRQQALLQALLRSKDGLTVDELAGALGITRTAVNQHLSSLARSGFVVSGALQQTGGRPGRVYVLTQAGVDLFPKQYSWFSSLFVAAIKQQAGSKGLERMLKQIVAGLLPSLQPRLSGKTREKRLAETVALMNELSYDARLASKPKARSAIVEASNCVYHALALVHPEVCEFDLELLRKMSGSEVKHEECIVRGGNVCRFQLTPSPK